MSVTMADQQPEKTTAPASDVADSQPAVVSNTDTRKETTETAEPQSEDKTATTTAQPAVETTAT